MQYESRHPRPTPDGPRWETWLDACQLCGGDGEIEVERLEECDLAEAFG